VRFPSVLLYINPEFRKIQSLKFDLNDVSQERSIRDSLAFKET
jgi:hypothetical protein